MSAMPSSRAAAICVKPRVSRAARSRWAMAGLGPFFWRGRMTAILAYAGTRCPSILGGCSSRSPRLARTRKRGSPADAPGRLGDATRGRVLGFLQAKGIDNHGCGMPVLLPTFQGPEGRFRPPRGGAARVLGPARSRPWGRRGARPRGPAAGRQSASRVDRWGGSWSCAHDRVLASCHVVKRRSRDARRV